MRARILSNTGGLSPGFIHPPGEECCVLGGRTDPLFLRLPIPGADDGSAGHHGFVTELLTRVLDETVRGNDERRIVACGPVPMMKAVAAIASTAGVRCQVSLETPMACGIGICFSCVAKVRQPDGGWDWKRTCVEGPIFDAARIEW